MTNKPAVTIIIPAHNEEEGIADVITQLKELGENNEIIVVDDGSTDSTYKLACETGVKVIRRPYNKGYGAPVMTGIIRYGRWCDKNKKIERYLREIVAVLPQSFKMK